MEEASAPTRRGAMQGFQTICGGIVLLHAETNLAIDQQVDGCLSFRGKSSGGNVNKTHRLIFAVTKWHKKTTCSNAQEQYLDPGVVEGVLDSHSFPGKYEREESKFSRRNCMLDLKPTTVSKIKALFSNLCWPSQIICLLCVVI